MLNVKPYQNILIFLVLSRFSGSSDYRMEAFLNMQA
jgi:hypothetical protein